MQNQIPIVRIQTGMRIEKRMVKVLKALAEYLDMTLGDLIEGIVLHAFDGKVPFNQKNLKKIKEIKKVYELDLDSTHSHKLTELKKQ
jgi:predicted DNA-binding ribbon-helix-helix protein